MKIHQITEIDRKEPKISLSGNPRADIAKIKNLKVDPKVNVAKNLPTSVDIKPGILGPDGKRQFVVVDQDGKMLKRFSGPNAEADANTHRDNIKSKIKADVDAKNMQAKADADAKANAKYNNADAEKDPKAKKKSWLKKLDDAGRMKRFGGPVGMLIGIFFTYDYVKVAAADYMMTREGGDKALIQKKKLLFTAKLATGLTGIITGAAGGMIGAATASRLFLALPGFGWLATLIVGGIGTIAGMLLNKIAHNKEIINPAAEWLAERMTGAFIEMFAPATVYENQQLAEDAATSEIKNAMKSAILDDPKMMQAFKKAQQMKRAKSKAI